MPKVLFLLLFCLPFHSVSAQTDSTHSPIATVVFLDSFVVTAQRQCFQVNDFVELVQNDESFYEAFKNLRFVTADFNNQIIFYDKDGSIKADYSSLAQQKNKGACRTMKFSEEKTTGNFFKNKRKRNYRYYTAKMYDRVFFTRGRKCGDPFAEGLKANKKGLNKHINELKKLIFQPGKPVNVPIVGKKTQIFSKEVMPYYNYSIRSKLYQNQRDC
ncbi:MAG: hypothetical protein AB8G22_18435, partial [Saprospiraceae bacterium]